MLSKSAPATAASPLPEISTDHQASWPGQNPYNVHLASLQPASRRTFDHAVRTIAALLAPGLEPRRVAWWAATYAHAQALRAAVAPPRYVPATANNILSAYRSLVQQARKLGHMSHEAAALAAQTGHVPGSSPRKGRHLDHAELRALFDACRRGAPGARDAAALALLYGGGMRREEVRLALVSDYNRETGVIAARGKGNKARSIPLPLGAQAAVEAWLNERGHLPGPLLNPIVQQQPDPTRPLDKQALWRDLKRLAQRARIAPLAPHDLRRTYIGDLLDNGTDLATASRLAGHANTQTTARYDRRDDRAQVAAASRLHVPFQARG